MSAWANIEKPNPINFTDILSEEISRNLQAKKEKSILDVIEDGWTWIESDECECKIAEKNTSEVNTELCESGNKKTSLNNVPETNLEEEDIRGVQNKEDFDIFDHLEDELTHNTEVLHTQKIQNSEEVINKHDFVLKVKKKSSKLSSLPFKLRTDDGKILDVNSSFKFFKSLKIYFRKEEQYSTDNKCPNGLIVLDPHSHFCLYQMITSRLLQSVDCVINISSEGTILHGTLDPSYEHATKNWPKNCAIKVFKKVSKSQSDLSYQYKEGLVDEGKTIQWWAQKEMDNLVHVWKAGVPCPQVIQLKGHILLISFIGKDRKPAPKLKYAALRLKDYVSAYEQVKNTMTMLYQNGNLIHGDMSEYNILWQDGQCYFIDFSHSVHPSHDHGYYFLLRDCANMIKYFKQYIPETEMESPEELFESITGFHYGDKILLYKMQYLYEVKPDVYHKPRTELSCV